MTRPAISGPVLNGQDGLPIRVWLAAPGGAGWHGAAHRSLGSARDRRTSRPGGRLAAGARARHADGPRLEGARERSGLRRRPCQRAAYRQRPARRVSHRWGARRGGREQSRHQRSPVDRRPARRHPKLRHRRRPVVGVHRAAGRRRHSGRGGARPWCAGDVHRGARCRCGTQRPADPRLTLRWARRGARRVHLQPVTAGEAGNGADHVGAAARRRRYPARPAALHLAYLAAGRFDAGLLRHSKLWDIAAGLLVAAEAGVMLSGPDSAPTSELTLAAAPALWREFSRWRRPPSPVQSDQTSSLPAFVPRLDEPRPVCG